LRNRRSWIIAFLFLLSTINYMDRVALSISGKSIAHDFHLTPVQLGYLFSSFLWLYVVCLIPMGGFVALLSDLLDSPADIGVATAALIFGGNVSGILAPIVTGYVIAATGNYNWAFAIAGVLLVVGCASCLFLARGVIGSRRKAAFIVPSI
jgi:hypothetical protein